MKGSRSFLAQICRQAARAYLPFTWLLMLGNAATVSAFDDSIFSANAGQSETANEADAWYTGWRGSVTASLGAATENHGWTGFNRRDSGLVEQLYLLKLSREWWLNDSILLLTGVQADARHYQQQPRSELVPADQYDNKDIWVRPQETYLQWNISQQVWLRHGYYVVSYGMSDAFDVIDKLTPRDSSRWGQELSSSSREPLWLSQAIWDLGESKIGLTVTHGFQANRIGLPGSDYDSSIQFRETGARVNDPHKPDDFTPEWVLDGRGTFPSGDWALLVGEIYNKNAVLKFDLFDSTAGIPIFTPQYTRTQVAGLGVDYATGSLVWKGELVWLKNYDDMTFPGVPPDASELSQYQALAGVDFSAPGNTILSIESRFSQVHGRINERQKTQEEISIQIIKGWLNERLRSQLRIASMPDDSGRFYQLALGYELNDSWKLEGKYTNYIKTESENYFSRFEDSDRILVGLNFQF